MSLRIRLSLVFAGFAVVLVTLLGLAAVIGASTALRAAAERQLSQAAHQMSERLDLHMSERLNDITLAAGMNVFVVGHDRDAQRSMLERLQREVPNYAWIGLAGPEGRVLVSTGGLLEGEDVSARPWFAAGRLGAAALDVHEAKLLQRFLAPDKTEMLRFVDVTSPVYDRLGRFVGVLAAHLSWDWADQVRRDVLSSISDLQGSDLLVLSRDGRVLLGPPAELGALFDRKAETYVAVVSPTKGMAQFQGLGWSVVARQPTATAFMPVTTLTWVITLIGAILATLAALAGWKAANAIAEPLSRLAGQAAAVQQGADVSALETGSRITEVATLSGAIATAFGALRQKEEELLVVNALLEERVLFRTRQLEEARQRAEAATQAKSDFLATVSHEIRSPLNSIIGFADLLLDEPDLPVNLSRRIRLIQSAGEALTTVINDILDWSKIEAGKVELVEDTFSPSCLLATSLELVEVQGASKGLRLELRTADDLPAFVRGDMARLRQIVLNLLNNAVKFTEAGSVVLSLARSGDADLAIEVIDTGIGMSPEQLGRLFGRFSQADSSIERRFGGSGLGLAISRALADLMQGSLSATSELGRGSTFTLTLPLIPAEAPVEPLERAAAGHSKGPAQVSGRTGRILLVEDIAVNREIAGLMLERAGYSVAIAENGHRAIELVAGERFDLVLMDVQMPGLDGLATTREIRAQAAPGPGMPIVALTANVMSDKIQAFFDAGMDDFVAKPIQRPVLLAKVAEWLERTAKPEPQSPNEGLRDHSIDRDTFEEVVDLLGVVRVARSLEEIGDRVASLADNANDRAALAAAAHALVSHAGVLGLFDLAEACRRLEAACESTVDPGEALATVLAASVTCLRAASDLARASAGAAPGRGGADLHAAG